MATKTKTKTTERIARNLDEIGEMARGTADTEARQAYQRTAEAVRAGGLHAGLAFARKIEQQLRLGGSYHQRKVWRAVVIYLDEQIARAYGHA